MSTLEVFLTIAPAATAIATVVYAIGFALFFILFVCAKVYHWGSFGTITVKVFFLLFYYLLGYILLIAPLLLRILKGTVKLKDALIRIGLAVVFLVAFVLIAVYV